MNPNPDKLLRSIICFKLGLVLMAILAGISAALFQSDLLAGFAIIIFLIAIGSLFQ